MVVGVDDALQAVRVLENAARRGTEVHAGCHAIAMGLWVPKMSEDTLGYVHSFRAWFDTYVEHVYFAEEELIDEALGLVGHPDIGCRLVDGRNMVTDYKTPAVISKTWGPQTSAYLHLAKSRPEKYDGSMALQLRQDGGPAKATVFQYSHEMFSIYLSALNAYRYFCNK